MTGRMNWILRRLPAIGLVAATLISATASEATDYWLAPEQASIGMGSNARIQLFSGERLEVEREQPLDKKLVTRYEWLTGGEPLDLLSSLPDRVQPVFKRPVKGTGLLVMDRIFVDAEGTYDQFRAALEREENEEVAKKVKNLSGGTRVRYAWSMKTLAFVGTGDDKSLHNKEVGQKLEILLQENPRLVERGKELGIQVLFDGKPLKNELVRVFVRSGEAETAEWKARTDSKGNVRFKMEKNGLCLVRVTHVRKSKDIKDANWDAYLSTFSFHYR